MSAFGSYPEETLFDMETMWNVDLYTHTIILGIWESSYKL